MKKKNIKKLIPPIAALLYITSKQFFGLEISEGEIETVLTVALTILVATGIIQNNDKKQE